MGTKVITKHVGGSRFYTPLGQPEVMVPGVTSVINMLPKGFLAPWSAKMTAELAVKSIGYLEHMTAHDAKGAVQFLSGAARRYSSERSDIGTEAHDLFERMIRGEDLGEVSEQMAPYVRHFAEFMDRVKPELISAEDIAWSDTHNYAGSYDALLRIRINPETKQLDHQGEPVTIVTDWKTGKSTYPDVALQLSAYDNADRLIDAEGNSRPAPDTAGGAVLHITEGQWAFKTVDIKTPAVYAMFLSALAFFNEVRAWEGEGRGRTRIPGISDDVIGKALASSGRRQTGTERRGK